MLNPDLQLPKEEAKEYKPFPEDVYTVQLLDVNSKEVESYDSKEARKKDANAKVEMETVLDFQFVLLEGKDGDTNLRGRNIFQNFVPTYLYISSKGKNKLFQIVEALQGSSLSQKQEAEGITGADLNSFIGKHCRVGTVNKAHGDKIYSNIDKFLPVKEVFESLTSQEKEDAKIKPKADEETERKAEAEYTGEDSSELTAADIPFGG
jgi:hypothetical protein